MARINHVPIDFKVSNELEGLGINDGVVASDRDVGVVTDACGLVDSLPQTSAL